MLKSSYVRKATPQINDESEVEDHFSEVTTVVSRPRNGILLFELPRRLSPIIEVNFPDS